MVEAAAVIRAIRVEQVTKLFGATAALRGVSMRFDAGAICFLEGGNGAGKSTLLAIMGTVMKASSGRVEYAPGITNRRQIRGAIGWVAHESHCYRELTGEDNVRLAARMYGVDADTAWKSVCGRLDLGGFGRRRVGELSRGQRQRVAIARALVHRPAVLLMDEPWTGLDLDASERLGAVLCEERDRGALIVAVSHVREHAEMVGARRVRLERGRIVADVEGRAPAGGRA